MSAPDSNGSSNDGERGEGVEESARAGYVDEFDPGGDFIPKGREARRDDVRNLGSGSAVGISCLLVVLLAVAVFWMVRGCLMG
jgi:hypothetical protein